MSVQQKGLPLPPAVGRLDAGAGRDKPRTRPFQKATYFQRQGFCFRVLFCTHRGVSENRTPCLWKLRQKRMSSPEPYNPIQILQELGGQDLACTAPSPLSLSRLSEAACPGPAGAAALGALSNATALQQLTLRRGRCDINIRNVCWASMQTNISFLPRKKPLFYYPRYKRMS